MNEQLPRRADGSIDVLALVRESNGLLSGRDPCADGFREAERQRRNSKRMWAAIALALNVETLVSIERGLPVCARNLDPIVLRHALRGQSLPNANSYVVVTQEMLDAVAEADGALTQKARGR